MVQGIIQKTLSFFGVKMNEDKICSAILPFGSLWGGIYNGEQEPINCPEDIFVSGFDYYTLARKAYTLFTTNEFARIAITRLTQFAIGTGLRLHPEPCRRFLKRKFNIKLDKNFSKDIQELWSLFEKDKSVSHTKRHTIHQLANLVFLNSRLTGDVLIIKRVIEGNLEYQIINGLSVYSTKTQAKNGNKIISGVEIDDSNRHVAFYVQQKDGTEKRIEAYDSSGRVTAWLAQSNTEQIDEVRSYPSIGAILQKLRHIGKYANAEVMAADVNARFALTIEHEKESSGVNPLKGLGVGRSAQIPEVKQNNGKISAELEKFKQYVKKIASGILFSVPKGQKLSSFDTKRPNVNYTNFLDGSMKYIFAALGIPFEVATLMFSNNFSASRAALKMFELIVDYFREFSIVDNFYQTVYEQFFEIECLKGNIDAPRFLALKNDLGYMDNAYTKAKFIGKKIPHIDEVKEANAVIAKLKGGLMTYEQALEALGNSVDFDTLVDTRKREQEQIEAAGLNFDTLLIFDNETEQKEGKDNE